MSGLGKHIILVGFKLLMGYETLQHIKINSRLIQMKIWNLWNGCEQKFLQRFQNNVNNYESFSQMGWRQTLVI